MDGGGGGWALSCLVDGIGEENRELKNDRGYLSISVLVRLLGLQTQVKYIPDVKIGALRPLNTKTRASPENINALDELRESIAYFKQQQTCLPRNDHSWRSNAHLYDEN